MSGVYEYTGKAVARLTQGHGHVGVLSIGVHVVVVEDNEARLLHQEVVVVLPRVCEGRTQ